MQNIQNGSVTGARKVLKKLMEENPNSDTGSTDEQIIGEILGTEPIGNVPVKNMTSSRHLPNC